MALVGSALCRDERQADNTAVGAASASRPALHKHWACSVTTSANHCDSRTPVLVGSSPLAGSVRVAIGFRGGSHVVPLWSSTQLEGRTLFIDRRWGLAVGMRWLCLKPLRHGKAQPNAVSDDDCGRHRHSSWFAHVVEQVLFASLVCIRWRPSALHKGKVLAFVTALAMRNSCD